VAEAEAAKALAALTLRVTGYAKDTTPYILDMPGTVSRATPKTTAPNPLDTSMTPLRSTKKQRVTGTTKHDYDFSTADSTAAVSSLTASKSQRLIDLETQVKSLQEGAAPLATQDMGEILGLLIDKHQAEGDEIARQLHLGNKQSTTKYLEILLLQLEHHNVFTRVAKLPDQALTLSAATFERKYNSVDSGITAACRFAESVCTRPTSAFRSQ
jgi:hypothetical protein